MNKVIYTFLFFLAYSNGYGQSFLNGDLNGSVNFVSVPTSWTQIPDTDPICQANTPPEATVDILDATGPNAIGGVAGNPFSGNTFCSGLHSTDGGAFLWHEGLMQTVNGFTVGNSYTINFNQTVVKQQNAIDESGSWRIYLDGLLIGTSAVSTSQLAFDDINLQWDCRSVTFNATAASHTIKFIPWDDDPNLLSSTVDITGGLRMGIDQIEFTPVVDATINPSGPYCDLTVQYQLTAVQSGGIWSGLGVVDPNNGTFDTGVAGFGNHWVYYSLPSGCGVVTDSILISVETLTYSSLLSNESCNSLNGEIILSPNNGAGPFSFSIDGGITTQAVGTFSGLGAGIYNIEIIDQTTGCSAFGIDTLINLQGPVIDSVIITDPTCAGLCDGSIDVYSSTGTVYSINGSTTNGTGIFNFVCADDYSIIVEDLNGCVATEMATLSTTSGANAQFGYSPGYITPTENLVNLFNTSSGADSYIWEINGPNGFYDVYDHNISFYEFPTTIGAYQVCLIAVNTTGCQDTTCAPIIMQDEFTMFIPNAFTPNDDEFNHSLVTYINGIDIHNFEMIIYNRWGEVVFKTKDKDHYWDGTYNGNRVPDGTYTWRVVVKDPNQDDHKEFFGHVNVIK